MLGDVVIIDVHGIHQDWKTYKFQLDIQTPRKKVFNWLCMKTSLMSIIQTFVICIKKGIKIWLPKSDDKDLDIKFISPKEDSDMAQAQTQTQSTNSLEQLKDILYI